MKVSMYEVDKTRGVVYEESRGDTVKESGRLSGRMRTRGWEREGRRRRRREGCLSVKLCSTVVMGSKEEGSVEGSNNCLEYLLRQNASRGYSYTTH